MTIYLGAVGWGIYVQVMSKLPSPYPELAERSYIPDNWDEFYNITEYDVLEKVSFYDYLLQSAFHNICTCVTLGNTCTTFLHNT